MKVVFVVCSGMQSSSSLVWGGGGLGGDVTFRPGMGINYFPVSHFTCMTCIVAI